MPDTRRPNLLWIFSDQLRSQALSCGGDPNSRTPRIDQLAAEGVRFTHAVSQYPVCMPFRGGLVTGQYAHVNGVCVHGDMLTPDHRTIAHAFRAMGYRTSWVGKWHLASSQGVEGWNAGADYWVHPYLRGGFEDWFGFDCSNHYYNTRYCTGNSIFPPLALEGYQTDALTNLSLNYLSDFIDTSDQPWFHCLSVEAPHSGTDDQGIYRNPAPPEYEARFRPQDLVMRGNVTPDAEEKARAKLAGYYAQVANLDDNVGRVLQWLEDSGQAENTLVVFFSDHGEMGGSHGMFEKGVVQDESIRVPLIMRLPGVIPAGRVANEVASGVDIFPTCASFCGVPIPPEVQGIDLSPSAIGGKEPARTAALVQWLGKALYGFCDYQVRAIRTLRYTYSVSTQDNQCVLYDNDTDELQLTNLYGNPACMSLQRDLHQQLRRNILRSGEAIPDFVEQVTAQLAEGKVATVPCCC